jgi:hypothetical protein
MPGRRPRRLGACRLGPTTEFSISRDQCHRVIGRLGDHVHQGVVPAAVGVDHRDPADGTHRDTAASLPFQDDDDRWDEMARYECCRDLVDKGFRGSGSISPPCRRRTGPHDVGGIDHKHRPSLIAGANPRVHPLRGVRRVADFAMARGRHVQ